ncbi:hypothetical protein MMC16_004821 [Acarospora aff. strigata]|nr:hypothetical protein [Acarospora aff. strigata]
MLPVIGPSRPPPPANYILQVSLCNVKCPTVTRILSVPTNLTFHEFHQALQIAFGWSGTHMYRFEVLDPTPADRSQLYPTKVHLALEEHPEPPMIFNLGPGFPIPQLEEPSCSRDFGLWAVFEDSQFTGKAVEYHYNFGDGWVHSIKLVGRATESTIGKVVCLAGEGHPVAEDAGGCTGWQRCKEAYATATPNKEQCELQEWFEKECSNADLRGLSGAGSWRWDQKKVNRALSLLSTQ